MKLLRLLPVVLCIALVAGCGTQTIDMGEAEGEIASGIEAQTDAKDVEVACPDDIEVEKDATFECEATAPGGLQETVTVTQLDDEGNLDWKLKP